MNIAFPLLFGAVGAAAGWLVLLVVNRTTPETARHKPISTLLVVGGSAALVVALWWKFRADEVLVSVYSVLGLVLIGVTVFDLRKHQIPHVVTIPGTIAGLILSSLVLPLGFRGSILGLLMGGGILLVSTLIEALRKKEIGGGDWKYAAMIGSFIGPQRIVLALILTGVFGAIGALALAISGNHARPHALGPWLSAGAVASILLG